jgi:hypothetical protein
MASDTVKYTLTQTYQNISQAAVDCFVYVREAGDAEIYFGPIAGPAASKAGITLNASDRQGMAFGSIATATDAVFARTQAPGGMAIHVIQKAT